MDVCFGGTFDKRITKATFRGDDEYRETNPAELIRRKLEQPSRLYLTSGGKEYVPDGKPGQHSPFTRKLLEALSSHGGKLGVLTMQQVRAVLEPVIPEPRAGDFEGHGPGGDFLFISTGAVVPDPVVASRPVETVSVANNPAKPAPEIRAVLTKLSLGDFTEIIGLKIGDTTKEVGDTLGPQDSEFAQGRELVWVYSAGGSEQLRVIFDLQTKVIRSISFDENHRRWLGDRKVDESKEPKLALFRKSSHEIESLMGQPSRTFGARLQYDDRNSNVQFYCAERNSYRCTGIVITWKRAAKLSE